MTLGVSDRDVLHAAVAVVDQLILMINTDLGTYDWAQDCATKPTGLAPRAQYLSRFFGSFGTMEIVVTLPPGP